MKQKILKFIITKLLIVLRKHMKNNFIDRLDIHITKNICYVNKQTISG